MAEHMVIIFKPNKTDKKCPSTCGWLANIFKGYTHEYKLNSSSGSHMWFLMGHTAIVFCEHTIVLNAKKRKNALGIYS